MIQARRFAIFFALAFALAAPAARASDIVVNLNDLGYPNGSYDPSIGPAPGTGSYSDGRMSAAGSRRMALSRQRL